MAPTHPNGGWFNAAVSSTTTPPLGDDRAVSSAIYPASSAYADFYASNVRTVLGTSWELSVELVGGNPTVIYPDNLSTASKSSLDNHAKRGQSVAWEMCYGNLGTANTIGLTVNATLSTSPTSMGTLAFGSVNVPAGVLAESTICQLMTSTVPATAAIGTSYYIVFGSGSGGNDIARVDRQLLIDP